MILELERYRAKELVILVERNQIDPYDAIDELARRITARRRNRVPENPEAIRAYARLSVRFGYKPLPPLR